jgi:alkanesulfonate monooxygenase SsuD/methylene tetrahydromethanopterin reductase-like flavin-dependent oxidoreductase (luciferase family)
VTTKILEFGLGIPATVAPGADPVSAAQAAEQLGYDFVTTSDHPCGTSPSYETWTMLSWIAAATSTIRVGTRVLGVPYRNPALVAKMAETFQRLSAGRLILGLGGGYSDDEFRAFGMPVPSPREKVSGMADAITIAHGLWTEPSFSYAGQIYHTDDASIEPKPDRPIPIWLGTFGKRALQVTGELADGWIPTLGYMADDEIADMRSRVLRAAEAAGRDPGTLTCALHLQVAVGAAGDGDQSEGDSGELKGSADAVTARLVDFVHRGFTAFSIVPSGQDKAAQIERIAKEVLPAVRSAV